MHKNSRSSIPIVGLMSTTFSQIGSCLSRSIQLTILSIHGLFKEPRRKVTERIHGNDLLLVGPLREWPDVYGGFSVGEVRSERRQLGVIKNL